MTPEQQAQAIVQQWATTDSPGDGTDHLVALIASVLRAVAAQTREECAIEVEQMHLHVNAGLRHAQAVGDTVEFCQRNIAAALRAQRRG